MTDKVQKIREEVERLKLCTMDEHMKFYSEAAEAEYNALCNIEHFIDSLPEEPVSEDLESEIDYLSKRYPEVSFAKLSRIAVHAVSWQKQKDIKEALDSDVPTIAYLDGVEEGKKRMREKMMKEAIGGFVEYDHTRDENPYVRSETFYYGSPFRDLCGKVKLIIIKQEEE